MNFCWGREPFILLHEIVLVDLGEVITPKLIQTINLNEFVLLDQGKNELLVIENQKIQYRTGGFGTSSHAFTYPADLVDYQLQILLCDSYDHSIKKFDHQLNFIERKEIVFPKLDPFYPEFIIVDPLSNEMVFSKDHGILMNIKEPYTPFIDFKYFGSTGNCVKDIQTDLQGNIGFLTCNDEILMFNRFGRYVKKLAVEIDDPDLLLYLNGWITINNMGEVQTDGKRQQNFQLLDHEKIISGDVYFQYLVLLTDRRILVVK